MRISYNKNNKNTIDYFRRNLWREKLQIEKKNREDMETDEMMNTTAADSEVISDWGNQLELCLPAVQNI